MIRWWKQLPRPDRDELVATLVIGAVMALLAFVL